MALGSTGAGGISAANAGMILLVEDDDRTSRLERFVLERAGYRVTHAFSGENALEMLPNFTPSLVLLDAPSDGRFRNLPKDPLMFAGANNHGHHHGPGRR